MEIIDFSYRQLDVCFAVFFSSPPAVEWPRTAPLRSLRGARSRKLTQMGNERTFVFQCNYRARVVVRERC